MNGKIIEILVNNLEDTKFIAQGAGILIESSLSESLYYNESVEIYNEAKKNEPNTLF